MRVLLIEDKEDQAEALIRRLRKLGYAVDWATEGTEADALLRLESYNLIVLDILLPGLGGQVVLRNLRQRRDRTPVLVLTALCTVNDKVDLLDLGADDYLAKPFDFREFEARCRALLRRPQGICSTQIQLGNLTFDDAARRVKVAGRELDLTSREFRLLELFLGHLNRVMSKEALMNQLFGLDEPVAPNAIELYVSRLRRKLEGASIEIRTVRGLGYVAERHASP